MQAIDELNDNNETKCIDFMKMADILKKSKNQRLNTDENISHGASFTYDIDSDNINNNTTLDKENLTQDNVDFMKWFCDYNDRLKEYSEEIAVLKKELIEKNLIIEESKLKKTREQNTNAEKALDSVSDVINKSKEDIIMKKSIMYDVLKEQLKFLIVAVSTIILSLIGIIVFATTGKYFIHPYLYVILLLMGIGWGLTAATSIKNNKV